MPAPLGSYNGVYEYDGGTKIDIVSDKDLFAVLDEFKYKLPRPSRDTFLNGAHQPITFQRDAASNIIGFKENGHSHRRLYSQPTRAALSLATPRTEGDIAYRYGVPVDRDDGINMGDIGLSEVGRDTACKIAGCILDQIWNDVHGILIYQHGKLVYEEYFYGYDWQRTHQLRSAAKSLVFTLAGIAVDRQRQRARAAAHDLCSL